VEITRTVESDKEHILIFLSHIPFMLLQIQQRDWASKHHTHFLSLVL